MIRGAEKRPEVGLHDYEDNVALLRLSMLVIQS